MYDKFNDKAFVIIRNYNICNENADFNTSKFNFDHTWQKNNVTNNRIIIKE